MECLAVLGLSVGLDITPQFSVASQLVKSHMRTCCHISHDRSFIYTTTVVEPVLAEAAARIQHQIQHQFGEGMFLQVLSRFCKRGIVENGYRGELVARVVLIHAVHQAAVSMRPM